MRSLQLLALTSVLACPILKGDFIPVAQPNPNYLAHTNLLEFVSPDYWSVGAVSDGIETASYDSYLSVRTVPASWSSWNTPPAVESPTPTVGATEGTSSLLISLAEPARTFGFEVEPDNLASEEISATFLDSNSVEVGHIDLYPTGAGGALLYAASTSSDSFSYIHVVDNSGGNFAIGQQRYSLAPPSATPEPNSAGLLGVAAVILSLSLKFMSRRKRTLQP